MLIKSVEIIKTRDEREMQKTTKEKQTRTERNKGNRSYSKRVRAKWFCCAFKSGFLQLICKTSLIYKSNLELRCCGGVWMFKNMRLVVLLDMLLHPSFKMTTSFANISRATASTSKFIY